MGFAMITHVRTLLNSIHIINILNCHNMPCTVKECLYCLQEKLVSAFMHVFSHFHSW